MRVRGESFPFPLVTDSIADFSGALPIVWTRFISFVAKDLFFPPVLLDLDSNQ